MSQETTNPTRTYVLERDMAGPAASVWRALTEPARIEQWLMPNDFEASAERPFQFRLPPTPYWNGVVDCRVLEVEPERRLSYSWKTEGPNGSPGLDTVVIWTVAPVDGGTRVRLEQSGFRPEQEALYQGAVYGWQRFVSELERVAREQQ